MPKSFVSELNAHIPGPGAREGEGRFRKSQGGAFGVLISSR